MNKIIRAGAIAATAVLAVACTKSFEKFNTNPDAVQEVDVKSYITTMQMDAVIPCSDVGANAYQRACDLIGNGYAGYFAPCQQFGGGNYTLTYALDAMDYNNVPFEMAFTNVMPAWLNLRIAYENEQVDEDIFAVAEVIKVFCLQQTTDIYGPIPASHFGEDVNPYDSQEQVYMDLMEDLNAALDILSNYNTLTSPQLAKVDAIFAGDYSKWYKLANSEKLRIAIRLRHILPTEAKAWAEEAVAAGVMETSSDGAWLKSTGSISVKNPSYVSWHDYVDFRMGATMDSYLNGYADPRLPKYFSEATIEGGGYHGIRCGIANMEADNDPDYTVLSCPNINADDPVIWMLASEVAFLKAEGALIGWNMGGSAKDFYHKGIELSFEERGLSAGAAAEYYTDNTKTPTNFVDCSLGSATNSYNMSVSITPTWGDNASQEQNLERIITQKWIALYPNGQEAWSEFRRTGYPRIIPIVNNRSNGVISTDIQVRRMTFPRSEYSNNLAQVQAAAALLTGGEDNGAARLWWDCK